MVSFEYITPANACQWAIGMWLFNSLGARLSAGSKARWWPGVTARSQPVTAGGGHTSTLRSQTHTATRSPWPSVTTAAFDMYQELYNTPHSWQHWNLNGAYDLPLLTIYLKRACQVCVIDTGVGCSCSVFRMIFMKTGYHGCHEAKE